MSKTVFVTLCDRLYYPRALRTIRDIRTVGKWTGDIVLITVDFFDEIVNTYGVMYYRIKQLSTEKLVEVWKKFPIKPMQDQRHTKKLAQFSKLHVFDDFFKQWDRVVFVDAGMRVLDDVKYILSLEWKGRFVAPDDTNRFDTQIDLDANPDVSYKILKEFGREIVSSSYFINCMWLYDTKLLDICNSAQLIEGMNEYPICRTNEMTLMNLFFHFKYNLWTKMPERVGSKYLYGWCEMNYKERPTYHQFCFLKYPITIDMNTDPITIGVAIPCYIHHIQKLKGVLNSIKNQTIKPSHVVVSCSSTPADNKDVNELLQIYLPFFQLDIITTPECKNAAENRNIASRHLQTDIISYMDADDIMHPQRLLCIAHAFEHSDCQIVLHSFDTGTRSETIEFPVYNVNFEYGKLERAQSGCAVHIDDCTKRIHHAHSSISRDVFERIQYREESMFNRIPGLHGGREDALFCGDVLQNVFTKNAYIPMSLSVYFEEGQTFTA